MPTKTHRRLGSIQTAADQCELSSKTIRRYISAGLLTGYRVGPRALRVDLNELEDLLKPLPTAGGDGLG